MLTAINGNNCMAQAQLCADSSHTALTKARLHQIATNQGLLLEEVPIAFQNFALATIRRSGNPIPENHAPFYSPEREDKTGGSLRNVVPNGVLPLIFQNFPFGSTETYVDSVFYEVKALSGGLLPLSYSRYQILGFLDALSRSDAVGAGKIPAIIFLTTADIRQISSATVSQAVFKRVGVLHAIACGIPGSINNL